MTIDHYQIVALVLAALYALWCLRAQRRLIRELENENLRMKMRLHPENFPPEHINCRCVAEPVLGLGGTVIPPEDRIRQDLRPLLSPEPAPKEYECPACGSHSPYAYMTCMRAGCPDGRDPR